MRTSGILLPVFSLPGPYGIGCFSKEARKFVDFLAEAGQTYWQILPLGPTGYGDSPYQSFSTFAGNPYLIDLKDLIDKGLLKEEECREADPQEDDSPVDYGRLYQNRFVLLRKAYSRSDVFETPQYKQFEKNNAYWLDDYALYMAIKDAHGGAGYDAWEADVRDYEAEAVDAWRGKLSQEIGFYKFVQYVFINQWTELKKYANEKGVRIVGDIPIYVSADSSDFWAAENFSSWMSAAEYG